jgi:hypothetical protein
MTQTVTFPGVASRPSKAQRESARTRFPPRPAVTDWPATRQERGAVWQQLTSGMFVLENVNSQERRVRGLGWLLNWLADQPGESWQQRWMASGADPAGGAWRQVPIAWQRQRGRESRWLWHELSGALVVAICGDIVRPSLGCLVAGAAGKGSLTRNLARLRDPHGFTRLRALCDADPHVSAVAASLALRRAAEIVAAKGGTLGDITVGDALELMDREAETFTCPTRDHKVFYRMLRELGIFNGQAPERLRAFRTAGQLTPEELVDRYQLRYRPVRDLFVDYLRERQPALDYTSLKQLAYYLAQRFWADLEQHHPGIESLHLAKDVAEAWKQRQRTKPQIITLTDGTKSVVTAERIGYRQCLTPVRAFYLDLSQWAIEDPGRWAQWAAPCPVGQEEISQRKFHGTARRAWTHAPVSGCRSCRCWCAPSTSGARTPPRSCTRPATPRPDRSSPPRARRSRARSPRPPRRSGPRIRPAARGATWDTRRTTPSGPGPPSRSFGSLAAVSRNCWRSATTV